jgi:hypothetical protein
MPTAPLAIIACVEIDAISPLPPTALTDLTTREPAYRPPIG